jgi:hypothetical protein
MSYEDRVIALPLAPAAGVAVSKFKEIDGPFQFILPLVWLDIRKRSSMNTKLPGCSKG